MDRPLDPHVQKQRRRRRVAAAVGAVALLAWFVASVPGWVRPRVKRERIRTAVVERGPLEATLTASGTVVPEKEQVLSCPVDTRLLEVLCQPGARVRQGDPVVRLDVSASRLDMERLDEQLALKRVEVQSESIATRQALVDLEAQRDIARLEVESSEIALERNQTLYEKGIVAENDVRAAQTARERARLELRRLEQSLLNTRRASAARLDKLGLERSILQKERDEAARLLELATARADRDGVLTWVLQDEGAAVQRGDALARIADLSSFRVEARIADLHGALLQSGMAARVGVGDTLLDGQVSRILPAVEDGTMTLLVDLVQAAHPSLRPNRRVDVHLVTSRSEGTLRVARGNVVHTGDGQAVFVVHGETAVRTPVRLGIASFEHQEVLDGLAEGDEVVISDMSDYASVREIKLR